LTSRSLPIPGVFIGFGLAFDTNSPGSGFEIAGCQWPKAGQILEMAGKNKFEQPSKKKMAGEIL
jgi:hypothetical protein